MKLSQGLMAVALVFGSAQLAYANYHETSAKHCQRHGLQDADANKDGTISHEEFTEAHKARSEKMFETLDANHDGKLDEAESKAGKGKMGDRCKMKGSQK
jgi:Ca2+-binding EF-hand superfamily protein